MQEPFCGNPRTDKPGGSRLLLPLTQADRPSGGRIVTVHNSQQKNAFVANSYEESTIQARSP